MSMMPPRPHAGGYNVGVTEARQAPRAPDATSELASLKARLESVPRPLRRGQRGMDHGPFQRRGVAPTNRQPHFRGKRRHSRRAQQRRALHQRWDEFAPFAEHAKLNREVKAEKGAIERVVVEESRSTRGKAFVGVALVGALIVAAGIWFLTARGRRSDEVAVQADSNSNVELQGDLKSTKKGGSGGGSRVVRGGYPAFGGGQSCESARNAYVEEMSMGGPKGQADLTAGQYGSVLNRGSYFGHCGVPDSMGINICAAVQNGRAVGVTVTTKPRDPRIQSCIAAGVRGLTSPATPSSTFPPRISERGAVRARGGNQKQRSGAVFAAALAAEAAHHGRGNDLPESEAEPSRRGFEVHGVSAEKERDPETEGRFRVTVGRDEAAVAAGVLASRTGARESGILKSLGSGSMVPSRLSEHARLLSGISGELSSRCKRSMASCRRASTWLREHSPLDEAEPSKPSASVLLRHRGVAAARRVRRAAAGRGAVPGLAADDVSVVASPAPPARAPPIKSCGESDQSP